VPGVSSLMIPVVQTVVGVQILPDNMLGEAAHNIGLPACNIMAGPKLRVRDEAPSISLNGVLR